MHCSLQCKMVQPILKPFLVKVTQVCSTLHNPMDYSLSGASVHGILQARILEWVAVPFSRGSSQLKDQTQVSCIAGRFFFTIIATGKPKNIEVGSLSPLQWIFPTQGLNPGLPHYRQILYCLSHWGSPQFGGFLSKTFHSLFFLSET